MPKQVQAVGFDTLLGYWKFDNNLYDSSGDNCNGNISSGTVFYSGNAASTSFPNPNSLNLSYAGPTGYVSFANQTNLKPGSSSPNSGLSFSVWIYLNSAPTAPQIIAGNYYQGTPNGFYFKIDTGGFASFNLGNGSAISSVQSSSTIPMNQWVNLIGVWTGSPSGTIYLYINGTQQAMSSFGGLIAYSSTIFKIEPFDGKIDDMRLYSRYLRTHEIDEIAAGTHTTATWLGLSSDYSNYLNWNISAKPDPYTRVNIPSTSAPPVFSESVGMAELAIETGASLNINQWNLTMNDSALFENNGNLYLSNGPTQILNGFVNDTDSGTITINPTAAATGLKAGSSYYNLTIGITGPAIALTLDSNLTVNGNFHINNGNLFASSNSINLKGNFASSSNGTFYPGTSTVYLMGTNQTILGSNDFYNLYKSTSTSDTLYFSSSGTQTILNTLSFQGASSSSQYLSLRSTTNGTQWHIDPQGTRNVSSLDIKDSYNINSTPIILAGRNIDSGNNHGWTFDTVPPTVTINSIKSPSSNNQPTITGAASDVNSVITAVKFQIDSSSGTWSSCTASDGTFNGNTELYSCKPASALSDGTHTVYIYATDVNSQDSSPTNASFVIDTTDPDISSVSTDPHSTSADISWDTDEDSSSKVEYGKSSSYGHSKTENESDGVKNHDVTISSLSECTEYHYRVISKDDAENESKSSDKSFKTSGCSEAASTSSTTTTAGTTATTATTTTTIPSSTAPQTQNTQTEANQAPSSQPPTTSPASTGQTYNGETSTEWQKKYFGNEFCAEENRCGGQADPDSDGLNNNDEYRFRTDPNNPDTDNDGVRDGAEIESGRNPAGSQNSSDDKIAYESPKEKGEITKDKCSVKNVEYVEELGKKKLKITGKGPPNSYLTVYVFSDPIVLTVKTDKDGNWSYVLDNNLDDGSHEVYVAVTDNTGKISEKSEPIAFVKTAEAVTVVPPAEAAAEKNAQSPTKRRFSTDLLIVIAFAFVGLVVALLLIGLHKHRSGKKETEENPQQYISM